MTKPKSKTKAKAKAKLAKGKYLKKHCLHRQLHPVESFKHMIQRKSVLEWLERYTRKSERPKTYFDYNLLRKEQVQTIVKSLKDTFEEISTIDLSGDNLTYNTITAIEEDIDVIINAPLSDRMLSLSSRVDLLVKESLLHEVISTLDMTVIPTDDCASDPAAALDCYVPVSFSRPDLDKDYLLFKLSVDCTILSRIQEIDNCYGYYFDGSLVYTLGKKVNGKVLLNLYKQYDALETIDSFDLNDVSNVPCTNKWYGQAHGLVVDTRRLTRPPVINQKILYTLSVTLYGTKYYYAMLAQGHPYIGIQPGQKLKDISNEIEKLLPKYSNYYNATALPNLYRLSQLNNVPTPTYDPQELALAIHFSTPLSDVDPGKMIRDHMEWAMNLLEKTQP